MLEQYLEYGKFAGCQGQGFFATLQCAGRKVDFNATKTGGFHDFFWCAGGHSALPA
jgi:hypothetical protein